MFEIAMKQWEHQGMQIGAKVGWRDEMENEIEEQESGEEPAAGEPSTGQIFGEHQGE